MDINKKEKTKNDEMFEKVEYSIDFLSNIGV